MILKNCTFFNELFEKELDDIKIENGKIAEIGYFNEDGIDMTGKIILPGLIDIHIHGGNGGDASDGDTKALNEISTYLAKRGITSFCPTTMTLPVDRLCNIAGEIANATVQGAKIAGINLEGPFIAKDKKGAQNGDYVVGGSVEDFDKIFNASKGLVKLITIAPEAFDSENFIKYVSNKAVVSIGHTCADSKQCQKAIDLGARHITHLYNAMTPMTHREAGVVGTALDNDNITCELICDGEHICPAVLRNTFDILGEDRACVISDSMRGAGLGCGEFELGGQMTYVKNGYKVARLADGTIAASITNIFDELKNLISFGIDFKTALKSCTINPARVIGMDSEIGSIAVGKCADLIVVDENLELKEVYINGILA
ncbi:MAG: N-acetylglucosamine-6-phosphate deacetylase [Eubacterium sp.]